MSLGHTDKVVPDLQCTHSYPIKTLPFPKAQALQAEAKKQLDELQAEKLNKNKEGIVTSVFVSGVLYFQIKSKDKQPVIFCVMCTFLCFCMV